MSIHLPEFTPKQIGSWIGRVAKTNRPTPDRHRPSKPKPPAAVVPQKPVRRVFFDFRLIRQALNRAATKAYVPIPKPLRRWRRNQGAVNQSVIDCLGGTVTVVEALVAEIQELRREIAELRGQFVHGQGNGQSANGNPPAEQ